MITVNLDELYGNAEKQMTEQDNYFKSIGFVRMGDKYVRDPSYNAPADLSGKYSEASATAQGRLDVENSNLPQELEKAASLEVAKKTSLGSALDQDIEQAIGSGQYTATGEKGKKSREQFINELKTRYVDTLNPEQVAESVYAKFRNPTEGEFSGLQNAPQFTKEGVEQTAKQRESTAAGKGVLEQVNNIRGLLSDSNADTGRSQYVKGALRKVFGPSFPGLGQPDSEQKLSAAIAGITGEYLKMLTGVQMSDKERNFYFSLLPLITDTRQEIENKLSQIESITRTKGSANSGSGQPSSPPQEAAPDPLGIR